MKNYSELKPSIMDNLHLRVFQAEVRTITKGNWNAQQVRDGFWRFYFNFCDGAQILWNDLAILLPAYQPIFVPAQVLFSCDNQADVEHFFIHFDWIGLPSSALREIFNEPFQASDAYSQSTREIALDVRNASAFDFSLTCRVKALLWNAISESVTLLPPEKRARLDQSFQDHAPVAPALRAIEEAPGARYSNKYLAGLCCLSEDYFIRRFSRCVGQTPLQYTNGRRLDAAAKRLLFSDASIEEIARNCGFANRNAFTRAFTEHVGVAPATYRRASRV